ncbi:DUF6207 family protein [Streptomyces lavendofoliae]|nr:DUF6207 family protein [Streptomyces lavendofoliae]
MEPINELHAREPGLVVVDVAAADDRTTFAFQQAPPRMSGSEDHGRNGGGVAPKRLPLLSLIVG